MKMNVIVNFRLSEHFSLMEFTRSATAVERRLTNMPSLTEVARMQMLCMNVLEPLRARFGVIRITSGYRCEQLNELVGGVKTSQHVTGEAADIHITGREQARLMVDYLLAEGIDFDQCIVEPRGRMRDGMPEPRWIHLSYREGDNRRQVLK